MKARMPLITAFMGAIMGYLLLSPFAMYTSHVVHTNTPIHEMAVLDVFSPENYKWFLPFMAFSGILGFIVGVLYNRQMQVEVALKKHMVELEEANHLKDLFSDIIHHDLMNPAGIIGNMATIMKEEEGLKDSPEIEVIHRNARKIMGLIQGAKEYAKLEISDDLDKTELKLAGVVRGVIDGLGMQSLQKGIQIEFNETEEHRIKAGDVIESVFVNILSNAIKYSGDSTKIKIEIEDDGVSKIVKVADQGSGVPDEHKGAIFTRFTRRGKEGVHGSGLGLAIVKRIVDLHGGRVWVEDNPEGKGSVFFVSLPKEGRI